MRYILIAVIVASVVSCGAAMPFSFWGGSIVISQDNFESYLVEDWVTGADINGGTGWSGSAVINEWDFIPLMFSEDNVESYTVANDIDPAVLTGGTGWSAGAVINVDP